MSFAKSKKVIHEQSKYNPPPGYYDAYNNLQKSKSPQFSRDNRFKFKIQNHNPGPGAYLNNDKQSIKKRLLQQANKKQLKPHGSNDNNNDIKISSIPSIPKKSTTRVYQQLAPGILILHQEEYQNTNVGPGSYDVKIDGVKRKIPGTKIYPEHKKKLETDQQPDIKVPTMAEQLRQEKRMLYKQNLYKSSNINKNQINSADLCLETIILREKLLRGDDIPPPGFYYNQSVYSSFKKNQFEKPVQFQALGGKQERFKEQQIQNIGPGSYSIKAQIMKKGCIISKNQKDDDQLLKKINQPGPGAYQIVSINKVKQQPKGNYPPIFGSGCKRFEGFKRQISQLPGPGSYKLDTKKKKKVKYIKVRKDFYDSQSTTAKPSMEFHNPLGPNQTNSRLDEQKTYYSLPHSKFNKQKNNHFFKSNVERFLNDSSNTINQTGPGQYQINQNSFLLNTFNRKKLQGYIGDKSQRFEDMKIRPNIGPGTYY